MLKSGRLESVKRAFKHEKIPMNKIKQFDFFFRYSMYSRYSWVYCIAMSKSTKNLFYIQSRKNYLLLLLLLVAVEIQF